MDSMRYFELGLGNSIEEDWETFDKTICIQGIREPKDFEEVNKLIVNELELYGYKTVVSITEITEEEAREYYNIGNIVNLITCK